MDLCHSRALPALAMPLGLNSVHGGRVGGRYIYTFRESSLWQSLGDRDLTSPWLLASQLPGEANEALSVLCLALPSG